MDQGSPETLCGSGARGKNGIDCNLDSSPIHHPKHPPLLTTERGPTSVRLEMDVHAECHPAVDDVKFSGSHAAQYDEDVTCGLCSIRCPSILESKFANKKTFLIIFCITSVLQGMYQTYFVSILTTIEKLYQIQSKTIGIIMSATEISQIIGSLFLTYYAGQGNRPRWIGIGILVFAISSLLTSTPHFIFHDRFYNDMASPELPDRHPLSSVPGNLNGSSKVWDHRSSKKLCYLNDTSPFFAHSREHRTCDSTAESRTQSEVTTTVLIIFFLSRFMIGIGATALNTLGISFLDDNVAPKESPLYFGKKFNLICLTIHALQLHQESRLEFAFLVPSLVSCLAQFVHPYTLIFHLVRFLAKFLFLIFLFIRQILVKV